MKTEDRKAAIAAYKKRKSTAGIFAVRCAATGQAWVGQTLNLDTVQNRIWFSLRTGGHSNRELQSAWSTQGAENFGFEALERMSEEELPYLRDTLLKERFLHWRSLLKGSAI